MINAAALARKLIARRADVIGYVSSTASLAIGLAAQTLAFVIVARVLGSEQYGELTLVMTWSSIGLMWCGLGAGEMMRRRVARNRADYPLALGHALLVLGATSLIIGLLTALILQFLITIDQDPLMNFLVILALVASNQGLTAWNSLAEKIFLAHENYAGANIINVGSGLMRAGVVMVACFVFGVHDLAGWAFWLFLSSLLIAIACAVAVIPFGPPHFGIIREELVRGSTMSLSSLISILRMNIDVMALGAVASPAVVGIYGVARRIVGTAAIVSHSFDRIVYSKLAVAGRDGPAATLKLARRYAGLVTGLTLAASALLYSAAPIVIPVFGAQYADAVPVLKIMSWTLVLTSLQFLAMDAINAADRHKMRLMVEGAVSFVCMALVCALTYGFALDGMLVGLYVTQALIVAALWGTLWWLAQKNAPALRPVRPRSAPQPTMN